MTSQMNPPSKRRQQKSKPSPADWTSSSATPSSSPRARCPQEPAYRSHSASVLNLDVNTIGPFLVTKAHTPLLKKTQKPRVVFMSTGLASITDRLNPDDQCGAFQFSVYRSSKAALNMIMAHYAALYTKDGWKVNAGFRAKSLNGYRGWNTVESGLVNALRLATLGEDGPSGTFDGTEGPVKW